MRKQESDTQQYGNFVPTTFKFPREFHTALKTRAGMKGTSMTEIVMDGVKLALESERYKLSDNEKKVLLGCESYS